MTCVSLTDSLNDYYLTNEITLVKQLIVETGLDSATQQQIIRTALPLAAQARNDALKGKFIDQILQEYIRRRNNINAALRSIDQNTGCIYSRYSDPG